MREGEGAALARLIDALPPERREHVFTHSSWAPDRASSYERLEFLGDSVLELAIARALYDRSPTRPRAASRRSAPTSSRGRAAPPSRATLDLGARARRSARRTCRGRSCTASRCSRNVLAALLEAAIAAVYLEHGFDGSSRRSSRRSTSGSSMRARPRRHKTELQEALARTGRAGPVRRARRSKARRTSAVRLRRADRRRAARERAGLDEEGRRAGGRGGRRSRRSASRPDRLTALHRLSRRPVVTASIAGSPSAAAASLRPRCTCAPSGCAASSRSPTRSR